MQEIICTLGQSYVFEEGEEILKKLLGLTISAKQIQRVSEHYGAALENQEQVYASGKEQIKPLKLKTPKEPVYVMFDGSMIFTKEEGWKEIKVGRIFTESSCVAIQKDRKEIQQSQYVCHLGGHKEFFSKWENYTEPYLNKICIADGAKWIWNWATDCYPDMIQVLDFFHAVEKIGSYAALKYIDKQERMQWLETQKIRLRNNEVGKIITELKEHLAENEATQKVLTDAIRYYENNECRMQYKTYLDMGYLIGSGAIESAHRNVVQQRLKLSGQRWSIKRAQQIVNLRACKKSNRWDNLINTIRKAA